MLNPGLGPMDYYAELSSWKNEEYLSALRGNILGLASEYPFFFLDLQFVWHPGATYWHKRFDWMIRKLSTHGLSVADSTRFIAGAVSCMQLVPYHSADFRLGGAFVSGLESAKLVTNAARSLAADKSRRIVVMRAKGVWRIPKSDNVTLANDDHQRGAFLTACSIHGEAVFERLQRALDESHCNTS